jgi:anti-sigma regulatory factor (Ser/Thr protein kinase)
MSACPLITAADGGATWPWLTSPAALTAPARLAGFPRIATRTPGADLAAVRAARSFTRATLQRWDIADRCDDITLVVSELLTNALEHAAPRPGGWPVRIGLLQSRPGTAVLCAVADASPAPPIPAPPGHLAESGRGLHVIEELSDGWGYTTAPRRGKVVWATFEPAPGPLRAVPRARPGDQAGPPGPAW